MKLVVANYEFSIKPKQVEGKLLPKHTTFTVKPKPAGVILQKHNRAYVIKQDARFGVVLKKIRDNKTLKQND